MSAAPANTPPAPPAAATAAAAAPPQAQTPASTPSKPNTNTSSGPGDAPAIGAAAGSSAPSQAGAPASTTTATAPNLPTAGAPGTTAPASADWTMMGYDLSSTYHNAAETKLTKDNAAQLQVAWSADMGGNVYGAALQVGDKMYATAPGSVRAFDAASGMQLWKTTVSSTSALSYVDGTLYLNTPSGKMISLNAADGTMAWSNTINTDEMGDGTSSAIPVGDIVLVGGSSGMSELTGGNGYRGFLSALDRKTGMIAWTTYTVPATAKGASIWSTASADPALGLAYAGTGNNYGAPATDSSDSIIAFDLKTGEIKWKNQRVMNDTFGAGAGPDSDFGANPVLYEAAVSGVMTKLVADGMKGGTIHAINRETGTMVWSRSVCMGTADGSLGIFTNFMWTGKNLVTACNTATGATLFGLDGATGDMQWMRQLSGQVWGRTANANGVGFVGTGPNLEAFDVDTGALIKSFPGKGGSIASTITIANGRVAFGEGLSWSSGVRGTTLTVLALP
jgi:glucose dehydrogenase